MEAGIIQSISTIDNLAEITKSKAEELAPLAADRENFGTQKEMLYGENAAINLIHGPAQMLKNSKEELKDEILQALILKFSEFHNGGGLLFPSATWIVTAKK